MKLTKENINQIAQELESGMKVFVNRTTLETKSILDYDFMYGVTESWDEELEKTENQWEDYVELEKMDSCEAFKIMEAFVYEIEDEGLQEQLIKILNQKRSFANFKTAIETSPYREKWFQYRTTKHEEYVRKMLEIEGIDFE